MSELLIVRHVARIPESLSILLEATGREPPGYGLACSALVFSRVLKSRQCPHNPRPSLQTSREFASALLARRPDHVAVRIPSHSWRSQRLFLQKRFARRTTR